MTLIHCQGSMPTVPRQTKCIHLGCVNERTSISIYCNEHGGNGYNDTVKRKQSNAMYQTALWSRTRIRQLSTQPLCQSCAGMNKVTSATEVDHLFAWQVIGVEAFYYNVFQSLCKNCHSRKGALERKGIFRHYTMPTPIDYTQHDYQAIVSEYAGNLADTLAR
jgi:5-methylcytosine-specific restriction enzyme A